MKLIRVSTVLATILTVAGCADLSFYEDSRLKTGKVGLKTYYSKPYILVARDGTEKVTSVSVVYLPDLAHPVYARAKSGYGSANLTLGFTNGMITSFGQQTDTKIPETLTALGGLDAAMAAAKKSRAEAAALDRQAGDFGKYSGRLLDTAKELRNVVNGDSTKVLTPNERTTISANANELEKLATAFAEPGAAARSEALIADLSGITEALGALKPASDQLTEDAKGIWDKLQRLQKELAAVLAEIKPKEPDPPALSLYEVVMDVNGTTLREVPLPEPKQ